MTTAVIWNIPLNSVSSRNSVRNVGVVDTLEIKPFTTIIKPEHGQHFNRKYRSYERSRLRIKHLREERTYEKRTLSFNPLCDPTQLPPRHPQTPIFSQP
jgi:hypothetical protein